MDYLYEIQKMKTQAPGVIGVHGVVLTTAAGAIGTANVWGGGASIVKGAGAGQYVITIAPPVNSANLTPLANLTFMGGWAVVQMPDNGTFGGAGSIGYCFKDDDISAVNILGAASAKDGTIDLQFVTTAATPVAANIPDGTAFFFAIYIGTPDKT